MTWREISFAKMATPQARTSAASHVRRRSTMSCSVTSSRVSYLSLRHGESAVFSVEPYHLVARGRKQLLVVGELVQALGAEEFRFLQIEVAALIEQAAFLQAQGFELVACDRGAHEGRRRGGDDHQHDAGGADYAPAGAARLRVGLPHEARVIDLFAEQQNVFVRQGAQREGIAFGARARSAGVGFGDRCGSRRCFDLSEKRG